MPGCSIKTTGLPHHWHGTATPNPSTSKRPDANFTIEWKGHYRIEGDAFIYVDSKTGGTRAILGYPTQKLEHAAHGARGN